MMPFEDFACQQCGHCCLNLYAYQNCATKEDYDRWVLGGRADILAWVNPICT
jgi:hypothetical protein